MDWLNIYIVGAIISFLIVCYRYGGSEKAQQHKLIVIIPVFIVLTALSWAFALFVMFARAGARRKQREKNKKPP